MGGNGNDVLNGLGGNDVLDGEAGEDIAYYEGKLSDYQFQQNANGLLVKGATTGTDILIDIESLYFAGEDKYYTPAEALEAQDSTDTGTDNGSMNHIHGGAEDDYLEGTDGNDHMMGGAGMDVFRSSAGNDMILGETGDYNQIDYEGKVSDYTFTANEDGTVTVTKPNGTDTISDIGGVWFLGEAVWHSMDDLVAGIDDETDGTDQTGINEITGTDGEDYLFGTSGDDLIDLGTGLDVVVGSAGDDTINGGDAGYNQVDYLGASSDYTFARNEDGSVTVTKADGTDSLTDIGGVWFGADAVWMSMDELTGSTTGGGTEASAATEGDDYLLGTDGDDVINGLGGVDVIRGSAGNDTIDGGGEEYDQVDYAGSASDYVFAKNTDGSFTSTASNGDVDLLIDIDGIWFEGDDQWVDIEDAA